MIDIFSPPEDNTDISREALLALAMQQLQEDDVQNLEEKEHMITRNGKLATIMQQPDVDEAQKLMEKE